MTVAIAFASAVAAALYLPVRRRRWALLASLPELAVLVLVLALVFWQRGTLLPEIS